MMKWHYWVAPEAPYKKNQKVLKRRYIPWKEPFPLGGCSLAEKEHEEVVHKSSSPCNWKKAVKYEIKAEFCGCPGKLQYI